MLAFGGPAVLDLLRGGRQQHRGPCRDGAIREQQLAFRQDSANIASMELKCGTPNCFASWAAAGVGSTMLCKRH